MNEGLIGYCHSVWHHVISGRFPLFFSVRLPLAFIHIRPFAILVDESLASKIFGLMILFEKTAFG
jgi:hypothetical protein